LKDIANLRYNYLNIEYWTRNFEWWSVESLCSIFLHIENDRIPYFDIHNSLFDILRLKTDS